MNNNLHFDFSVDKKNSTINVVREFAADLNLVWAAWTTPEILDLWWAPKPYQTKTKSMNFTVGGTWLYAMMGPNGDTHWCRADYKSIDPLKSYAGLDGFCDEVGNLNYEFPRSLWHNTFVDNGNSTTVNIEIKYDSLADLEKVVELGFKEGFTMALGNLDQYIEQQFKLRNSMKTNNTSRVSAYLNFPGNTEEAMLFYQSVFKSEFTAPGIQRFGDLPADPNQPPVAESVKNMVLHVELPIMGNFVLMATDAPKEMGFNVMQGNNMHIQLEPDSKEEAIRLFNALSEGGKISMELQDMFWGALFGSFTDKFGINWMINHLKK